METLGRYPLSVILSFLSETDGVSLLITNQRYASQLLPLFRLRFSAIIASDADGLLVVNGTRLQYRHRHRFVVSPVQDPAVLLGRLNTRRLHRRRRPKRDEDGRGDSLPYPANKTTEEIARREWSDQNRHHTTTIPPELELLRFYNRRNCPELEKIPITLLVSYPRSGNTLVRTLLERATGVVTGSDTRPDRSLSRELAERHGLAGEGLTGASNNNAVAFVKSHWPERTGNAAFAGRRAILLVRNPYDAIDSYWNMNATKSHTETVTAAVYEQFKDKWEGLARNEIQVWTRFLDYWLRDCPVPVLIVRFEDLIRDPTRELTRTMKFALQQGELSQFWKKRVRRATSSSSTEQMGSYRPRTASQTSIGKSIRNGHYSAELLDYIHQVAAAHPTNYLQAFGYDVQQQGFPSNFAEGREPCVPDFGNATQAIHGAAIRVNAGQPVRPVDCPYGRLIQKWRHSITDNDSNPLPTEGMTS